MSYQNLGSLNRLLVELIVTNNPALSIQRYAMGRSNLDINKLDPANIRIDANTGSVNSPQPYQKMQLTINILKTTGGAAQAWEEQVQKSALVGDVVAYTDSAIYGPFTLRNCSVDNIQPGMMDGNTATVVLTLTGDYVINNDQWSI